MNKNSSLPFNHRTSHPGRYLAAFFPFLATDRIERDNPLRNGTKQAPLAVIASLRNTVRIVARNAAAARLKLTIGMGLADARARYPALLTIDADPARDQAMLERIAEFCERYTPLVAIDPPRNLILDISGCTHLFGGEAGLRHDMADRLHKAGFSTRIAIADTVGCASALARYNRAQDDKTFIVAQGGERECLMRMPVAALRLPQETVELLDTFGLRQIGDLYNRPRAPLTARFGEDLVRRLDQALGVEDEPISPLSPVQPYIAEQRFAEPIGREEDVLGTIEQLVHQLARLMERQQEGGRCFIADLFRVDGAIQRLVITTGKPLRETAAIRRLFTERLAQTQGLDPGFGYDLIRLSAGHSDALPDRQENLDAAERQRPDITSLIDRFGVRFGRQSTLWLQPSNRHPPEYAITAISASEAGPAKTEAFPLPPQDSLSPLRPIRLFAHPEPIDALAEVPDGPPLRFRWRRLIHDVAAAEGPERIAPEWWRDGSVLPLTRDYFRVETREGARVWLYREGLYERETARPHWFIHGLFA